MTGHDPKYQTLIDASKWALSFLVHRDEMNTAVHGTDKVKWSQTTRHVALGMMIAGERDYDVQKVMYSWDSIDPELDDSERQAINAYFEEIR